MAFQQIPFQSNNICAMPEWQRNAILSGQVKTDSGTMANARNWQFMNAAGYKQAATVNDIPAGSTTFALTSASRQTQVPASYGKDSLGTMTVPGTVQNWYKPPEQPAAPSNPAAPAAPAAPAPEERVDTICTNAPSPNKPVTDFGSSGSGAFGDKPRDDDEGYLDNYLSRENSDYKQWWSDRAEQNEQNKANSSDWDRYFRDEYKKSEPLATVAKDHEAKDKRWRMAGGGDFLTGINGFLGNYSKADSA